MKRYFIFPAVLLLANLCNSAGVQEIAHRFLAYGQSLFANGDLKTDEVNDEKKLQLRLLPYFREGSEVNGGETDIVLRDKLVIENKLVQQDTRTPHDIGPNYAWQGRRYSIAVVQSITAEFVEYKPVDEAAIIEASGCLSIKRIAVDQDFAVLRCVLPWNYGNSSDAKAPKR